MSHPKYETLDGTEIPTNASGFAGRYGLGPNVLALLAEDGIIQVRKMTHQDFRKAVWRCLDAEDGTRSTADWLTRRILELGLEHKILGD